MTNSSVAGHRRAVKLAVAASAAALFASACGSDAGAGASGSTAATGEVSMVHYFSDEGGSKAMAQVLSICEKQSGEKIKNSPAEQEAFKDAILVQLAGSNPPDLLSYWAGAKTQYLVDQQRLAPLDDVWAKDGLDEAIPGALAQAAATYSGKKYLLPLDYHYVGMFYNPKVMAKAGITEMPKTWDEMMTAAEKLKAAGITPFALGSKNRWPAQFWFDYLLLRTAGPDYRAQLMAGKAKYTDPQVAEAFDRWKQLFDKGYFNSDPNGYDWPDASDMVASGKAAMTLMGTWISGYWEGNKVKADEGYDFFPFPEVTPGVPQASLGPVDGFAISAGAKNKAGAEKVLACLASAEAQQAVALTQGALAPNPKADLSSQNEVMHKAAKVVGEAPVFAFNYDLATTPEMSDAGLNALAQFVNNPADAASALKEAQSTADGVFGGS
ncbi:ABC transporter substrate-binding protein [Microtetraspora malaysiensis]|uniref:ABC transporter substrate-binding protein n=1 Tax=Microtetraspora malaysiensis TaxID=161358 RepID=UPI003D92BEF4